MGKTDASHASAAANIRAWMKEKDGDGLDHVVINTSGANQLALRTGISSTLIPNVMEFENSAPGVDDYNADGLRFDVILPCA